MPGEEAAHALVLRAGLREARREVAVVEDDEQRAGADGVADLGGDLHDAGRHLRRDHDAAARTHRADGFLDDRHHPASCDGRGCRRRQSRRLAEAPRTDTGALEGARGVEDDAPDERDEARPASSGAGARRHQMPTSRPMARLASTTARSTSSCASMCAVRARARAASASR